MKIFKKLLIFLLIVVGIVGAGFGGCIAYTMPTGHFYMDEELDEIHGDSNPTDEAGYGEIGFKNGKLYYEFRPSELPGFEFKKGGVYEIDENGARLWNDYDEDDDWRGIWNLFPEKWTDEDEEEEEDEFDIIDKVKDVYNAADTDSEWYDEMSDEKLYTVTDDYIIYLSTDFYFKKVDRKTFKCLEKIKLKDNIINFKYFWQYTLISNGDKLLLVDESNNYTQMILYDVTKNYKKLFEEYNMNSDDIYRFHCYKNKLFLYSDKGIWSLDTNSGNTEKLTSRQAWDTYIFGDKWIYFISWSRSLYRVSQDGAKEEKVFSMGW